MPLHLIRNDITKVKADAIVNTANPEPVIGAGTDQAVYEAAGADKLLEARRKIGCIEQGEAYATPAFELDATFIIHTVGPVWENGDAGECGVLESCYLNSLELAAQYKCRSVAFPLISSGVYGFPKDVALSVAQKAIDSFLEDHDIDVYLVVFDDESLKASRGQFSEIKEFVDDAYVRAQAEAQFWHMDYSRREREAISAAVTRRGGRVDEDALMKRRKEIMNARDGLAGIVGGKQMNFADKFFEFMAAKGMESSEVYKGYFDRKTYSKFQTVENYHPSKGTAILACLGLHLTLTETVELLASASYSLNPSFDPDIVMMYCILNKIWEMRDVNVELERYGLPEFNVIY